MTCSGPQDAHGGNLTYHEDTNYTETMKALPPSNQMACGRVLSHPVRYGEVQVRKGIFSRLAASVAGGMQQWLRPPPFDEMRFLIVGLDGSGRTTILYRVKLDEVIAATPTIDFNEETVQRNGALVTCLDVGGTYEVRHRWRRYFKLTNGVIFVVDANARDRFEAAEKELGRFLSEPELQYQPLLVLANKQDLPGAAMPEEVAVRLRRPLQLVEATGAAEPLSRPWCVQGCSAIQGGAGLIDGFDWLVAACRAAGPAPQ